MLLYITMFMTHVIINSLIVLVIFTSLIVPRYPSSGDLGKARHINLT